MAELSIAIADDNRQTLNLLGEILEKEEGIHVVGQADNGEDAYQMMGSCPGSTGFPSWKR